MKRVSAGGLLHEENVWKEAASIKETWSRIQIKVRIRVGVSMDKCRECEWRR